MQDSNLSNRRRQLDFVQVMREEIPVYLDAAACGMEGVLPRLLNIWQAQDWDASGALFNECANYLIDNGIYT